MTVKRWSESLNHSTSPWLLAGRLPYMALTRANPRYPALTVHSGYQYCYHVLACEPWPSLPSSILLPLPSIIFTPHLLLTLCSLCTLTSLRTLINLPFSYILNFIMPLLLSSPHYIIPNSRTLSILPYLKRPAPLLLQPPITTNVLTEFIYLSYSYHLPVSNLPMR